MVMISKPPTLTRNAESNIAALHSYLYKLSETLQAALEQMTAGESTGETAAVQAVSGGSRSQGTDYEQLKSLIVKSASRTATSLEELAESISREYVGRSEYGTFTESVSKQVDDNERYIQQVFDWRTDVESAAEGGLQTYLAQARTYMKYGLLYYETVDGQQMPRYGMAIGDELAMVEVNGEKVLDRSGFVMTLVSNRLTFWRNDQPLAYFDDQQLVVNRIRLSDSMQVGHYAFKVMQDGSMGIVYEVR